MDSTERLIRLLADLDDEKISKGLLAILTELQVATEKFGAFNSESEGLEIINEEVDELKMAIRWNVALGKKYHDEDRKVYERVLINGNPEMEATQVGAMAFRYLIDCVYK